MTDSVQCPICDFALEKPDVHYEVVAGVQVPTAEVQGMLQQVDAAMRHHLEDHSTDEWVRAFAMADRYIEVLEAQVASLKAEIEGHASGRIITAAPAFQTNQRMERSEPERILPTFPEAFTGVSVDDPRLEAEAERMRRMLTPREFAEWERRMEARRQVAEHDSNQTLIPFIPTGQRPEGVVGRKG